MISLLLLPCLALAFSSAPQHLCKMDSECSVVRHTYCGNLESITQNQDSLFTAWEKKEREQAEAEHRVCEAGSRQDPRNFEPYCDVKGICALRAKAQKPSDLPPPPATKPEAKKLNPRAGH